MVQCIDAAGHVDWTGYHLLTTAVPLSDFLDLEELALVAGDRKFAWDVLLTKNPGYMQGLTTRTMPAAAREDEGAPRRRRAKGGR